MTVDYRKDYTEEELARLAFGLKLEFAPGSRLSTVIVPESPRRAANAMLTSAHDWVGAPSTETIS